MCQSIFPIAGGGGVEQTLVHKKKPPPKISPRKFEGRLREGGKSFLKKEKSLVRKRSVPAFVQRAGPKEEGRSRRRMLKRSSHTKNSAKKELPGERKLKKNCQPNKSRDLTKKKKKPRKRRVIIKKKKGYDQREGYRD